MRIELNGANMSETQHDSIQTDDSIYRKVIVLEPDGTTGAIDGASGSHDYTFVYFLQPGSDAKAGESLVSNGLASGKSMVVISPGISSHEALPEGFRSQITVQIDAELFRETAKQYAKEMYTFRGEAFTAHPELLGVIRCFLLEQSDEAQSHRELLDHLAQVIVHLTAHSIFSEVNRVIPLYDRFEVERSIAYMNDHISEKITMEDLAGQAHRSAVHFSKIFKSVTSQTPIEFLQSLRLQKARRMLSCGVRTISEIALECGFSTPSYFSNCFMEKYKITPSAYREKYRQTD